MLKGVFRKADFILMAVLIIIGIASSAALALGSSAGDKVRVTVGGELYGTYPLGVDQVIIVDEKKTGAVSDPEAAEGIAGTGVYNIVVIEGSKVSVTEASCMNQVCVHHAPISMTGESIICLPNRVVVSIEGKDREFDAVSS